MPSLTCPECGRTYNGDRASQALGGHRFRSHGVRGEEAVRREQLGLAPKKGQRTTPEVPPGEAPTLLDVRTSLRELTTPLHDQLAGIDGRLATIDREARELREARKSIVAVLDRLDPNTRSASTKTKQQQAVTDSNTTRAQKQLVEKADALEKLLVNDPQWTDGFTANRVADELTHAVPRGLSTQSARQALELLRDRGVVRADRITRGGGMQFKLVTSTNGADSDGTQTT